MTRAALAAETLEIVARGGYVAASGRRVDVSADVRDAVERSRLLTPDAAAQLVDSIGPALGERAFATTFGVANETTLAAGRRLVDRFGAGRVALLNFASAKNPGGGWLGNAQAQEESLARASALVVTQERHFAYYEANRGEPSLLYTDHLIVSPGVPVFRGDDGALLDEPWRATFLTSPAPNAGAAAKNQPASLPQVEPTLRRRMEHVLSAAVDAGATALVLGAWGCGVFKNDPATVARLFAGMLANGGRFARAFEHVAFAVLDRRGDTLAPFAAAFGPQTD